MLGLLGPAGETQEVQLPSGTQEEYIMGKLNRELGFSSVEGTRVMSREEFLNLKASGADVVVVEKEGGATTGEVAPIPRGTERLGRKTLTRKCECACLCRRTGRTSIF